MKGNWLKIAAGVLAVAVIALVLVMVPGRSGQTEILRVATTTSLYDTGLWDYLEIIFEGRYDVDLQITAKGTGASLELGKNGDVDVVTVHDPLKEAAFIDGGYGVEAEINGNAMERIPWAYNYYIILGSEADPAGIGGGDLTPQEAFQKILQEGSLDPDTVKFVSRGDESGTHGKEKTIWASAGYNYTAAIEGNGTDDDWYLETGQGMGTTLQVANEKLAYTLTDKGTFLAYKSDLDLVMLVAKGDIMLNVYMVMICSNGVNPELAQNLVTFLRADDIQALIAEFGVPEYGEPLFYHYDPQICG